MTHYLIEFRFSGYAKKYLKELIYGVSRKFNVRGVTRHRTVPHISLVGPFYTTQERRLVSEFARIVSNYELVGFKIKGFGKFGNWLFGNRVIYVNIEPSKELGEMRRELSKSLQDFCKLKPYDYKSDFHFHATIAFKDISGNAGDILKHLKSLPEPDINQYLLRVTIIKNKKILCEYDLMQKRLLTRFQAKNKKMFTKTIKLLQERQSTLPTNQQEKISD